MFTVILAAINAKYKYKYELLFLLVFILDILFFMLSIDLFKIIFNK